MRSTSHDISPTGSFVENVSRAINILGAGIVGVDAVCKAILGVCAVAWEGTPLEKKTSKAVVLVQIVALGGRLLVQGAVLILFGHESVP